jgi:S-formylglutathione hydrolase
MFSYVTEELPALVASSFPADPKRQSIMGHSMGGHGALICALKKPQQYVSASAFAPIASASQCPWGHRALSNYLGADQTEWRQWDAAELLKQSSFAGKILVDQGTLDKFLEQQLKPELLSQAAEAAGRDITLRLQAGYDHSYYFISSFMEEHLRFHAAELFSQAS